MDDEIPLDPENPLTLPPDSEFDLPDGFDGAPESTRVYEEIEELGHGGMARVMLVEDPLFERGKLYPRVYLLESRHNPLPLNRKPPPPRTEPTTPTAGTGACHEPSRYHPACPDPWPGPLCSATHSRNAAPCNGRTRPALVTSRPRERGPPALGRRLGEDLRAASRAGLPPSPARSDGGGGLTFSRRRLWGVL